jgi:hypothetical protein
LKAKAAQTNQVRYQKYLLEILNPPKFIDHAIYSVIANFTVNLTGDQFSLPQVDLLASSYTDLSLDPDTNRP